MLSPRAQPWNKQHTVHVQRSAAFVMEAKSPKVSRRRFSRDPGLTELPLRLPAFSTVHHYVQAASLTGPVMHCAIWGLRHKLDQEHHRTVCAGPARARFGSIAWPSDNFLEVGRKDQGPVIGPALGSIICYISTYSQSHDCRQPIAPYLDTPCRVEVWSASGRVPGVCSCAGLPVPAPLSPPGRHTG